MKEFMKKKFMPFAAMALFTLASCQSSKNVATLSPTDLNGEWNIVEVNGSALNVKEYPYIGFNSEDNRIYGNSGCNRIMGSFELNKKPGELALGQMASTMMAGPNMDIERNVLNALGQVKGYKQMGKNEIALCNEQKRPVVILKKRSYEMSLAELNGEWKIIKVYGEAIPADLEKEAFIAFNTDKKQMSGCAGCNSIHGAFTTENGKKQSIAFPNLASTRMMCANMDTEDKVLKALGKVKNFGKMENGHLAFFANGTIVLELTKK